MNAEVKNDRASYWIRVAIWLALSVMGWLLPAGEIITPYGMKVVGIFAGLMFGWICLDLIYPSLLAVILMAFAGGTAVAQGFFAGFAYEIVVIIFILCTFIQYISHTGLDKVLADWFINLKFMDGKPWVFITMFMVLAFIFGYLLGIYAAIFCIWPITYKICEELGYQKRSAFTSYMLFAVTYICGLGMVAKPFDAWSLLGLTALSQYLDGYIINYTLYTIYMLIISIIIIFTYLLIGKFILKIDVEPLRHRRVTGTNQISLTHDQKLAAGFMIAFLVFMYLPSLVPESWTISLLFKQMGVIGMGALMLVVLGVWRSHGQPLAQIDKLAAKGIPFKIVFLMVGNCVVAGGLKSPDAGITTWIGTMFGPMVAGLSPILFYIALVVIYGVATQFIHNVVLLSVFTPIALTLSDLIGANPIIITLIGIMVLSAALATAGASSRSGLVYGNTEWIAPKYAYLLGISSVVMVMLVFIIAGIPLASMMFPWS